MAFRAAVVTFPGSNCDRDMAVAIEQVSGFAPIRVWHGDAQLPDGLDFIALPGGCGTLEELLEAITLKRLGQYLKPIVIVNQEGFYTPQLEMLEKMIEEDFMRPEHRNLWTVVGDPSEALDAIHATPDWDANALQMAVNK